MDQEYHQHAGARWLPAAAGEAGHAAAGTWGSDEVRRLRIGRRESQARFWRRFGVTQSSGSRFETGLRMPAPVVILVKLYAAGKLNDVDLPA
ncbi:MAG TPA: transcriptional regulator [Telluria sp.]